MEEGWFRTLRNLNPRLKPQDTQPAGARIQLPRLLEEPYASRCVEGPWPILAADLHQAVAPAVQGPTPPATAPARATRTRNYKVRNGDTLIGIVHRLHCSSVRELAELNGLRHHRIRAGDALKVPVCR
jgi:membrane-bound lytic murein transglycosylase D